MEIAGWLDSRLVRGRGDRVGQRLRVGLDVVFSGGGPMTRPRHVRPAADGSIPDPAWKGVGPHDDDSDDRTPDQVELDEARAEDAAERAYEARLERDEND